MSTIWESFLPHHTLTDLLAHPGESPVGRSQRFTAVALFADVSGFTAISEALAATGRSGAEELTTVLNSYFQPMIELITSYGGIIGKFGGDAMTVLFPTTTETATAVTRRAIQCALDMQARMNQYARLKTPAGTFSLTMKVGLAGGPLFSTTVGNPAVRLEYVIAGSALDTCADAEHHAHSGEIVLHHNLLTAAGNLVAITRDNVYHRILALPPADPCPLPQLPPMDTAVADTITAYIHPSIAQRLRQGQITFLNEHRQVTILFVRFSGFDYDNDPAVGDRLQTYFSQVVRIIHHYDGYLNKIDMGDKGSKYIVLFGAPIGHENDAERGLRCALELRRLSEMAASGITAVHIGINTGFVYCGQVGSARRQEYTVMGDAVNLAARLMQAAAPGQILVGNTTHKESPPPFLWASGTTLRVKGKSQPILVHTLLGTQRHSTRLPEPTYTLPMVGRQAELSRVLALWEQAQHGQGQIVGITAEAGMGKSRLVAEILTRIEAGDGRYLSACHSYGTTTNYLVWQNLLYGLFQLDPDSEPETQIAQLTTSLAAIDPYLLPRLPLLGTPLNLPIPDNDLTRSLDARLRKTSLESLIVTCLRHRAHQTPLLLVLEDCHWLDPLSNDLLEAVGRSLTDIPVLLITVYRPPATEPIQPQIRRFGHFTELPLTEFVAAEAQELIRLKLARLFGRRDTSPDLAQRLSDRAQGNPFYLDEMLNLIHDRGIDPTDLTALASFELPDSLHNLIISRIDQLREGPKTTLKVASVIGRLFRASWLWGSYPQIGSPERVQQYLEELGRLDLTPLDKTEPELEYLFKHIITREVAYESLAVATRSLLHEQIGGYIEERYTAELERYLDLLAYHYGQSQNAAKQRHYFAKMAAVAQTNYANDVALTYYQRLLPLLPTAEKGGVLLQMGQVWQLTGQWDKAETCYHQALELSWTGGQSATAVPPTQRGQSQQAIGIVLRLKGAYEEAIRWLEKAQHQFEFLALPQFHIDTLRELGIIRWYQGDHEAALSYFSRSRELSLGQQDRRGEFKAIGNLGLVYWSREDYDQALTCFNQCQMLALVLDDRLGMAHTAGNLGNVYLELGDYTRALNAYSQYLHIALELGYRQGVGVSVGNMGNVYWFQGEYERAAVCYSRGLEIALELGDRSGVGFAAGNMARSFMATGDMDMAEFFLQRAMTIARQLDTPYQLCTYLYDYGNLLHGIAQESAALTYYDQARRLAAEVENDTLIFEAELAWWRTQAQIGQVSVDTAVSHLLTLVDPDMDADRRASLHYEIWQLAPTQEQHRQIACTLFQELYGRTPNIDYRHNYATLTGINLPPPPPLPTLPTAVTHPPVNIPSLQTQIDLLLVEGKRGSD